jgi:hypothetical protein
LERTLAHFGHLANGRAKVADSASHRRSDSSAGRAAIRAQSFYPGFPVLFA